MISQDHCLQQSLVFQLVPGTTYYSLPTNYLAIQRVTIGSKWLSQMSEAALDGRSRGWEASSGYPTYYFVSISSRGLVGFAPWPATSSDTDTVKVQYDIQSNDLVNGTDIPFNGVNELVQYHYGLPYYAASIMSAIDGQSARSTSYMQIFQLAAAAMTKECNDMPGYRPSAIGTQ